MRIVLALGLAFAAGEPAAVTTVDRDRTAAALEECLAAPAHASTSGQTDCQAKAAKEYDRRMNAAYATLLRRLPAAAAVRLRASQRARMAYRDAEARARTALYATRSGTMFVPMDSDAATIVARDRARLLEQYGRSLEI